MLRRLILRQVSAAAAESKFRIHGFDQRRGIHSRNKKAMEYVAKGWSAIKEVDRVIDYCELNDRRLIPLLRGAKENFELALEADNLNTHARFWLSKLHLKYHVPGACKAIGAALLVEAADMGNADAQYELGCRLRVENDHVQSDQQAFHYIENAVDQLHPGALYLLGIVYLTGDCVKQDMDSAVWCFHRASEKGHAGAAIAYGSLLLRGLFISDPLLASFTSDFHDCSCRNTTNIVSLLAFRDYLVKDVNNFTGVQVPESLTRMNAVGVPPPKRSRENMDMNPLELAKEQFQVAARAGCDLGLKWLQRLEQEEKLLLNQEDNEYASA
ncbi:hypothetical protein Bca4012_096037 [Brassica carinata]